MASRCVVPIAADASVAVLTDLLSVGSLADASVAASDGGTRSLLIVYMAAGIV